jgi:hypothetical protein
VTLISSGKVEGKGHAELRPKQGQMQPFWHQEAATWSAAEPRHIACVVLLLKDAVARDVAQQLSRLADRHASLHDHAQSDHTSFVLGSVGAGAPI